MILFSNKIGYFQCNPVYIVCLLNVNFLSSPEEIAYLTVSLLVITDARDIIKGDSWEKVQHPWRKQVEEGVSSGPGNTGSNRNIHTGIFNIYNAIHI